MAHDEKDGPMTGRALMTAEERGVIRKLHEQWVEAMRHQVQMIDDLTAARQTLSEAIHDQEHMLMLITDRLDPSHN